MSRPVSVTYEVVLEATQDNLVTKHEDTARAHFSSSKVAVCNVATVRRVSDGSHGMSEMRELIFAFPVDVLRMEYGQRFTVTIKAAP